jgi:hypothetical protein
VIAAMGADRGTSHERVTPPALAVIGRRTRAVDPASKK